jgi:hypothetical protein
MKTILPLLLVWIAAIIVWRYKSQYEIKLEMRRPDEVHPVLCPPLF